MEINIEALKALSPARFELLVAELLELRGFHNVVTFGGTGDEGIDIRAEWLDSLPTGDMLPTLWAVQCKRYSHPIGPKHIETILSATLEPPKDMLPSPPDYFLLATTSGLTVNARRVVERANGNRQKYSCRFVVWDGETILKHIEQHKKILAKFFASAAAHPPLETERISLLRLSILLDSVGDNFVISFLCESESSAPICQRAQTKIARDDFDELIHQCRSLASQVIESFNDSQENLLKHVGGKIYDLIPSSIQMTLRQHGNCYLRISSNIHIIPFELAWDAANNEFLGSARRVGRIQVADVPIRPTRIPEPSILLIGAAEHSRFDLLPSAATELHEISSILSSWGFWVKHLYGDSVTLANVSEILRGQSFQVIHFAGHGVFTTDKSGLVFSEGIVSFEDLTQVDVDGALVFLSACSSGAALDEASRKYFQAGAVGLVGFVGPVTDEAANLIAVRFYKEIGLGATLGDALRNAREAQRREMSDDYSWVSLVLFGDPSRRVRNSLQAAAAPNPEPQADGSAAA